MDYSKVVCGAILAAWITGHEGTRATHKDKAAVGPELREGMRLA